MKLTIVNLHENLRGMLDIDVESIGVEVSGFQDIKPDILHRIESGAARSTIRNNGVPDFLEHACKGSDFRVGHAAEHQMVDVLKQLSESARLVRPGEPLAKTWPVTIKDEGGVEKEHVIIGFRKGLASQKDIGTSVSRVAGWLDHFF